MSFYDRSMGVGARRSQLDFQLFLQAYRSHELEFAEVLISRVLSDGSKDPVHLSYAGLLSVLTRRDVIQGLEMCEQAAVLGAYDPLVFLNLARVHVATGFRTQAVTTLRRGLRVHPQDPELLAEIERLSPRRAKVIRGLDRAHFANRVLGVLASKMSPLRH